MGEQHDGRILTERGVTQPHTGVVGVSSVVPHARVELCVLVDDECGVVVSRRHGDRGVPRCLASCCEVHELFDRGGLRGSLIGESPQEYEASRGLCIQVHHLRVRAVGGDGRDVSNVVADDPPVGGTQDEVLLFKFRGDAAIGLVGRTVQRGGPARLLDGVQADTLSSVHIEEARKLVERISHGRAGRRWLPRA